jgi:hypothetical protein
VRIRPTDQPVAYANAVRAVLAALVILGAVDLDGEQVAGIVVAVEAILGVFVWSTVTPTNRVEAKVDAATSAGRNEALADVASLKAPPKPRKPAAKKAVR